MARLSYYPLDCIVCFGKYEDDTLRDILIVNPSYIEWCLINVSFFAISNETLKEIIAIKPDFKLGEQAEMVRQEKITELCYMESDVNLNDNSSYDAYEGDEWAWLADNV